MKSGSKLLSLFRRRNLEAEMAEEMRHHLEEQTAANIQAGMSPAEARYAAQRQFGHLDGIKEQVRERRFGRFFDRAHRILRYTVRGLGREKILTFTILATLGLCLGANVAVYTVLEAVVLNPLPFPDADRLVVTRNSYPNIGITSNPPATSASIPNYFEWREGVSAFAEVAALGESTTLMGEGGSPERVTSVYVTPSFFRMLGTKPALGRFFYRRRGWGSSR